MKLWRVTTTILIMALAGASTWLFLQNKDLKDSNNALTTDLSDTRNANEKLGTESSSAQSKMDIAGQKIVLMSIIISGSSSQESSTNAINILKSLNDATLATDWNAMQKSDGKDGAGNKFVLDILTSAAKDLGVPAQ